MKKFIKNNLKVVIAFVLGITVCGLSVYAITASEVTYNNTTVDAAINNLYGIINNNHYENKILVASNLSSRYEQSISLTDIPNYQDLTTANFFIDKKELVELDVNDRGSYFTMSIDYDPETGTLNLGKFKTFYSDRWVFYTIYDVYVLR